MGRASRTKRERRAGLVPDLERHDTSASARASQEQERKISAALAELIDPYQDDVHSLEEYRVLVSIGATAWNLAILPESERNPSLTGALENLAVPDASMFRRLVSEMVARKEQWFPEDRRFIVRYDVSTIPTGYYLTVAAERAV